MRVLAAALGIVAATAAASLIWVYVIRRPDEPSRGGIQRYHEAPTHQDAGGSPSPLSAPQTPDERDRADYARKRRPFMEALGPVCKEHHAQCRSGDDLGTLEVWMQVPSTDAVALLRDAALALGAADFGFNRITFLGSAPAGSGQPPDLIAEVTRSPDRTWVTFMR